MDTPKLREQHVDNIKGLAILLVVIGHLLMFNTIGFENTILFNIIWSLQMPLFMFISGYLMFGKKYHTKFDFWNAIKKDSTHFYYHG